MELIKNIIIYGILGAICGFAVPIPISSNGHLIIFQNIFDKMNLTAPQINDITFEIIISFGSLIAITYYYRREIIELFTMFINYIKKNNPQNNYIYGVRYCILLLIATLPTVIGSYLFIDKIETLFHEPKLVGCSLLVTAIFILLLHKFGYRRKRRSGKKINLFDALKMGIIQLLSLLPGISRSGVTLSVGMLSGLTPKAAQDFSFLMFIPVSIINIILKLNELFNTNVSQVSWLLYLTIFLVSTVTTYLSLKLLFKLLKKRKLIFFSRYCLIIGILTVLFL
ncbi:undecaprenyl-diphosphate phosphatase [uncultured Thomasclavelia sp.]|uniref:undecaprenyl-diphosphate phosphatase n=1 Tax=uncultured Thomasclavelia sp. TaxID=3025759 RepID=UPI002596D213|nr:undecaprenyl-diphosphate phosphatase [uncultured Thomasclavelia sp.]